MTEEKIESWYRNWMKEHNKSGIATVNILDMLKDFARQQNNITHEEIEVMAEEYANKFWNKNTHGCARLGFKAGYKKAILKNETI